MARLWFDVGIKRYTTAHHYGGAAGQLWFDVGIKRYTTLIEDVKCCKGCGLM